MKAILEAKRRSRLGRITLSILIIFSLFFTGQIFTQITTAGPLIAKDVQPLVFAAQCVGGIVIDDGSFENKYTFNCGYGLGAWVQKLSPGGNGIGYPYFFNRICIALTTLGSNQWVFQLNFWDTTYAGPPGAVKDSGTVTATGIGTWPSVTWHEFTDLGGIPRLNNGAYFVGPLYDPCASANRYVGADENGPKTAVAYSYIQGTWSPVTTWFPNFKALGIRADGYVGISQNNNEIPKEFMLYQNYPNPFNPVTTIKFDLPEASIVKLVVYNMLGEQVTTFANNDRYQAGVHSITVDMSRFPSGAYFYTLSAIGGAGNFTDTKKMILIK